MNIPCIIFPQCSNNKHFQDLTHYFGAWVRDYIDYEDIDWSEQPFNGGCPVSVLNCGRMKEYSHIRDIDGQCVSVMHLKYFLHSLTFARFYTNNRCYLDDFPLLKHSLVWYGDVFDMGRLHDRRCAVRH